MMAGKLKQEIKQRRPFRSVHEEVILAMLRTADVLMTPLSDVLRKANLTQSAYNILRILRGAGEEGLACGEISERMVRRDPDLTRLLDRLEKRGLVSRGRDARDRRVVRSVITEEGLELLRSLDDPVEASLERVLAHVPVERLRALIDLLDEARAGEK